MIKNKKAAQHLEMIMAFIIFSSFVFFLLYFLPLPKHSSLAESNLLSLENAFENMTQKEIMQLSLKTNSSNCFSINLSEYLLPAGYKSVVKTNKNQHSINTQSYLKNNVININSIDHFFVIYLSDEFSADPDANCPLLDTTNYTLGGIEKYKKISLDKLSHFSNDYRTNYESLKQNLGIPSNLEFTIKIKGVEMIMEDLSSASSEVLAETKRYEMIDSFGTIWDIEVTFKIWS